MNSLLKKYFAFTLIAAVLPSAALAADVNFQLQIAPAPSIGITGFTGGSGTIEPSNPLPQNITVSGWTSPNALVEIISDGQIMRTVTAKSDGSFIFTSFPPNALTLFVRSTDTRTGQSTEAAPVNQSSSASALGMVLPPTISLPTTVARSGAIAGTGKTVPGGAVSVTLTDQKGKTMTQMPGVAADGSFKFSFHPSAPVSGSISLQVSVNYSGKTAVYTINGAIGKPASPKPINSKQPPVTPAMNVPANIPANIPINGKAPTAIPPNNEEVPITWFRPQPPATAATETAKISKITRREEAGDLAKAGISVFLMILAIFFCFKCFGSLKRKK